MAGTIARLNAALTWDLGDFDRGTSHIEGTFGKIRGMVIGLGEAFTAAGRRMTLGVTAPLAALAGFTVKAASDAEELQSAFDYTFGALAEAMNEWADETGNAMGRSTQEMQQGALALGVLFNQAAPTRAAAAEMSQGFTELAQDAASFFNTDFETALGKIRSGLIGESEPLRDFGVFLTEASVKAKALELGLIREGQELNENGKIMARAALIAEGLADAHGDVERTSGSLANRLRALKAELHELAVEMGERLIPYAERLAGWIRSAVERFKELPDGLKGAIVNFAIFTAAIGPAMLVLKTLATIVLPFFLVNLGAVGLGLSAMLNPLGTAIIYLSNFAVSWEVIGTVVSRIGPMILRVFGPIGLVIGLIITFRNEIASAFSKIADIASTHLGPKLEDLWEAFGRLGAAFDRLMEGPAGKLIDGLGEVLGEVIERLLVLLGQLIVLLTGGVLDAFIAIVDGVGQMVDGIADAIEVVGALLRGEWTEAWELAGGSAENVLKGVLSWVSALFPPLRQLLDILGLIDERTNRRTIGFSLGTASRAEEGVAAQPGGGNYAQPDNASGRSRSSRGKSGPSAEELASRREEIRLEHELAVARERGDIEAVRALERQMDLRRAIAEYQRAGLSETEAQLAAERDMAELDAARAAARDDYLRSLRIDTERRVAELNADYEHLRYLDEEEERERLILELREQGYDITSAELIAASRLAAIEEARIDAAERRLAQQERAHQIELARLRGDYAQADSLGEQARIEDRIDQLQRDGNMSRAEAEAQAMREAADRSRAHLQGTFRDTFRDGLRAAMNGDLKGWFENWLKERSFNALANVLDRLADQLANLVAGGAKSGGGLLGTIAGIFGGGASLVAGDDPLDDILKKTWPLKKFDSGGRFAVKGFPGIDQNLLSINNVPAAMVGQGEVIDVHSRQSGGGGTTNNFYTLPSDEFWSRVDERADGRVQSAAPGIMAGGAQVAQRKAARRQTRRVR